MMSKVRYTARDAVRVAGNVRLCQNGAEVTPDYYLDGAESGFFLDFGQPVVDTTSYLNTIPAGVDAATWEIEVPVSGMYRITFRYNNPGWQMGGNRNLRDERNCRVMLDVEEQLLGETGWLGWMIFNVSGYRQGVKPGTLQTIETIGGNTSWNENYLVCYLEAGQHQLSLTLQAPPGQAVYDGPNLDWLQLEWWEDAYLPIEEIPKLPENHVFSHQGLFLTQERRQQLQQLWVAQDSQLLATLAEIQQSPLGRLSYQPQAVDLIDVGPYNNPNIGGMEWTEDCIAAHYHAILWAITGNGAHGQKAIEILNAWSQTLKTVAEGNDLTLRFSLLGIDLMAAAEIMRYWFNADSKIEAKQKWQSSEIAAFEEFLQTKIYPKTASYYPQANGNWDAIIGSFNLAVAVFMEDVAIFNRGLRQFCLGDLQGIPARSNGALPNYLYATGESQESNRDQVHARMGITGLCNQAWIAAQQGVDLFSLYNERLLTGADYCARYQIGEEVPSQTFISDRGRGQSDISSMGFGVLIGYYGIEDPRLVNILAAYKKTLTAETVNEGKVPASNWSWLLFGEGKHNG